MKKILIFVLIISLAGYLGWKKYIYRHPIFKAHEGPYVIVYDCKGDAQGEKYIAELEKRGMNYIFADMDDQDVHHEVFVRMMIANVNQSEGSSAILPVIEVNGWVLINNPEIEKIVDIYNNNSYVDSPLNKPTGYEYYEEPYVVVFGVPSCGANQYYVKQLKDKCRHCIFKDIESPGVKRELWIKMRKAGIYDKTPWLPAVDVNGKFLPNEPTIETVVKAYNKQL